MKHRTKITKSILSCRPRKLHRVIRQALKPRAGRWAGGVLAVSLLGISPPVSALDLADLNGDNGFVINGVDGGRRYFELCLYNNFCEFITGDRSGDSVSGAGDINGDGVDDIIISAPNAISTPSAEPNGNGESYVVFGRTNGFTANLNLADLDGENGFVINIDESDSSGCSARTHESVSGAGDINGDGIDDLIIGVPDAGNGAGKSYVVFGRMDGFAARLNPDDLDGENGFVINGIYGISDIVDDSYCDNSGSSVSGAGDVNGDGIDDVIIGAPGASHNGNIRNIRAGRSYVVFGRTDGFTANLNLADLDGSNGFVINGIRASDYSGDSVSGAGDINGDGVDDVIIGAPYARPGNAGESYVVFGQVNGFAAHLNLAELDGSNGFVFPGISARDYSGRSVSGAGDVNGDEIDDLIIGAPESNAGEIDNAGESYVVFGQPGDFVASLNLIDLDGTNGFAIKGIDEGDLSGNSVSGAGDVNGDGVDDLIIGAFHARPNGIIWAGQSYVVFGRTDGFTASLNLADLNGENGFFLNGYDGSEESGSAVSGGGDINGDGIDDLIIGAPVPALSATNSPGRAL